MVDEPVILRDRPRASILVTPQGQVQSERNRKLTADGELVGYELGYLIYRKWDEETCNEVVTDRSAMEELR